MNLESKPAENLLLYIAIIVVSTVLMFLVRDFQHDGNNALCGFLLGCMLSGIGIMGLLIGESRQIIIPFDDIKGFGIGLQGNASAGSRYYDVVVRLNSGSETYSSVGAYSMEE